MSEAKKAVLTGDKLNDIVTKRFLANMTKFDIQHVATFCDVELAAVGNWASGGRPMGGLVTIKLWFFLEQVGIESPELKKVRTEYPLGEYLGRLLAFGVLSLEKVRKLCNNVQKDAIFRAIRAQGKLHTPSETDVDALHEEHDELLAMAVEEFQKKLPQSSRAEVVSEIQSKGSDSSELDALRDQIAELERQLEEARRESPQKSEPRFGLIQRIAERLQIAHVAANIAVHQLSSDERDILRMLMGSKGMFDFSNTIERLCGKRAFGRGA